MTVLHNPQFDTQGNLRHLLSMDGVSKALMLQILDIAKGFVTTQHREVKTVPLLRGFSVFNLFFENSTRTRTTFEIAAKRLSADVINIDIERSSTSKGESLLDTVTNLAAMNADIFVVRHNQSGAPYLIAKHVSEHVHVINAGDGQHAHPTQALLDMFTIRQYKGEIEGLRVAIIGDILHSRVARSNIRALKILGANEIRVIAPDTLLPAYIEGLGVSAYRNINEGLRDVDVIMALRLQHERMAGVFLPSAREFNKAYGLNKARLSLAKPDAIVLHPGPINRGVEIESDVADSSQSVILQQVNFGIAVRMAVMSLLVSRNQQT